MMSELWRAAIRPAEDVVAAAVRAALLGTRRVKLSLPRPDSWFGKFARCSNGV